MSLSSSLRAYPYIHHRVDSKQIQAAGQLLLMISIDTACYNQIDRAAKCRLCLDKQTSPRRQVGETDIHDMPPKSGWGYTVDACSGLP